ncbi:hypothetical protein SUGI_0455390 [Cryptomeria japonica]|nr:hypothetical protein SUGI_0455390 [Cryptomeria japonica]
MYNIHYNGKHDATVPLKWQDVYLLCFAGSQGYLPTADTFRKAIYIVEIGGNDFSYSYMNLKLTPAQLKQTIMPIVAKGVANAVKHYRLFVGLLSWKIFQWCIGGLMADSNQG